MRIEFSREEWDRLLERVGDTPLLAGERVVLLVEEPIAEPPRVSAFVSDGFIRRNEAFRVAERVIQ